MDIEVADKDIVTGYWGESSKLRSRGYALVSVSRGNPKGVLPDMAMPFLAPTWNMMKMSAANYNESYRKILESANPEQVWEFLPDKAALMCFEKHPQWCHRRMLAEWLEEKLGVEITEFGYPRSSVVADKLEAKIKSLTEAGKIKNPWEVFDILFDDGEGEGA